MLFRAFRGKPFPPWMELHPHLLAVTSYTNQLKSEHLPSITPSIRTIIPSRFVWKLTGEGRSRGQTPLHSQTPSPPPPIQHTTTPHSAAAMPLLESPLALALTPGPLVTRIVYHHPVSSPPLVSERFHSSARAFAPRSTDPYPKRASARTAVCFASRLHHHRREWVAARRTR